MGSAGFNQNGDPFDTNGGNYMSKTAFGNDRNRKHASPPHMMPSIIPAEGDNLTHSTHTHRSEDGTLTPNYVNRYSIGKGAKRIRSKSRLNPKNSGNNNDL
jgi:hypothetical protein